MLWSAVFSYEVFHRSKVLPPNRIAFTRDPIVLFRSIRDLGGDIRDLELIMTSRFQRTECYDHPKDRYADLRDNPNDRAPRLRAAVTARLGRSSDRPAPTGCAGSCVRAVAHSCAAAAHGCTAGRRPAARWKRQSGRSDG